MKTNTSGARPLALGAVVAAALVMYPTPALAAGAADASILVPKPAEFFPALVAFLVIWALLAKKAWPKILGALDARQRKIQADLDEAEQAKVKAAEEQRAYEARISDAERQAEEIVAKAKREAEGERSQILAKAQSDAAGIISKAHEAIDSERRAAMIDLSGSVVDLSVEIAGKIIGDSMDEERQRRLAERYLSEVGSLNGK